MDRRRFIPAIIVSVCGLLSGRQAEAKKPKKKKTIQEIEADFEKKYPGLKDYWLGTYGPDQD